MVEWQTPRSCRRAVVSELGYEHVVPSMIQYWSLAEHFERTILWFRLKKQYFWDSFEILLHNDGVEKTVQNIVKITFRRIHPWNIDASFISGLSRPVDNNGSSSEKIARYCVIMSNRWTLLTSIVLLMWWQTENVQLGHDIVSDDGQ